MAAEARALELFDSVLTLDESDLDPGFWREHRRFIRRHPRLFGYGIWKPHVVQAALGALPPDAILSYCDAGCSLNPEGVQRMREYFSLASSHPSGLVGFQGGLPEAAWTKMDVLKRLGFTSSAEMNSPQIWSGMFFMVNNAGNRSLVSQWGETMADYGNIDDSPSVTPDDPRFREHRHDQSIFSILFKRAGGLALDDETWWPDSWSRQRRFPIHARRWKHFRSGDRERLELAGHGWWRTERMMLRALRVFRYGRG
jgi:hypothetical protein